MRKKKQKREKRKNGPRCKMNGTGGMTSSQKGEEEEVTYMKGRRIWDERPIEECVKKTGKKPIPVRWVDANRGTEEEQDIRSRLVARDFKGKDGSRDDLFASTPPLEGMRMLCTKAVAPSRKRRRKRRKILFMDARKVHLNPWWKGRCILSCRRRRGQHRGCVGSCSIGFME
jgi:hypothetical protein